MPALLRLIVTAAAVAIFIYSLLALGERFFPQFYPTRVDIWLLPLLFAVAFVPRLIGWLVDLFLDYRTRRRRRQRRSAPK